MIRRFARRPTPTPTQSFRYPGTEAQIAELDKEVLGTEGRQIGRVTDLLRDVSASRGRVLDNDFARTLARRQMAKHRARNNRRPDRPCRGAVRGAPDRPSAQGHRRGHPLACRRREAHLDPRNRRRQRDRRYRARRRGIPPLAGRCRRGARGGDPRFGRAAACRGKLSQAVRRFGRRNLCDHAGRHAAQRQSGAGADHGIRDAGGFDQQHRRHLGCDLRSSGGARGIPVADAARRHGARVRISGASAQRRDPLALRQRHRGARRSRRGHPL